MPADNPLFVSPSLAEKLGLQPGGWARVTNRHSGAADEGGCSGGLSRPPELPLSVALALGLFIGTRRLRLSRRLLVR